MYKVPDPDDEIECPYDPTHMIRAKRFPYHLIKCRKNHRVKDFVTCPFNARHEVPRPELRYHVAHCADKALIYRDCMRGQEDPDPFKGNTTVPNYQSDWDNHNPEENWDEEAPPTPAIMFYGKKKKNFLTGDQTIEFTSDPPGAPQPHFRLPVQAPKILEATQNKAGPSDTKPTVFSMSMAGIGRGRGLAQNKPQPTPGLTPRVPPAEKPKPMMTNSRMAANIFGNNQKAPSQASLGKSTNENLADSLTALSRGRGGRMMARAPEVGMLASQAADSPDHSPIRPTDSPEVIRQKHIRKLKKKLRAIGIIEQKHAAGEQLDGDEIEKMFGKDKILKELAELSI